MRWCFWMEMEDLGRMEARVMQVLDRLQATVVTLSSSRLDDRIVLSCVIDAEEKRAIRIEALLRKIYGALSVKVAAEIEASQQMVALFHIVCDITDRSEILRFISAVNARPNIVRPIWVAFETLGTLQEIEGVYQSAVGYGVVDVVSSSPDPQSTEVNFS